MWREIALTNAAGRRVELHRPDALGSVASLHIYLTLPILEPHLVLLHVPVGRTSLDLFDHCSGPDAMPSDVVCFAASATS